MEGAPSSLGELYMILHNVKGIKRDTTITNFTSNCATIKYLRARGDAPPAEGREALQVREPPKGTLSYIAQILHKLHQLRKGKHATKFTNKLYKVELMSKKGSRGQLAPSWRRAFMKGVWMAQSPGDDKLPRTGCL